MDKIMRGFGYFIKTILFASFIAVVMHYFIFQPYIVVNNSLTPLYNKGEVILINRLSFLYKGVLQRNDIIVYRDSKETNLKHMSRIAGLPGEIIAVNDGILSIVGDERVTKELPLFGSVSATLNRIGRLDVHEFFVLDKQSLNSEEGLIDIKNIVGKPILRIWPLNKFNILN